jgi:tartrate/fumarate subfamily iron-sulfur-dependent hydro-lyase alpha chain
MTASPVIEGAILELVRRGVTELPKDVEAALAAARKKESGLARVHLDAIVKNIALSKRLGSPICQDTGVPIFFVWSRSFDSGVREGIVAGVREATKSVPLRPSVVHPITRENPGDNAGAGVPEIHWIPSEREGLEIYYMPKGAGSENTSRYFNLPPSDPERSLRRAVIETVMAAGGKPCPPTIIGIGIGSTMSRAGLLAKRSHTRAIGDRSPDRDIARLERKILRDVNSLGIGPMGMGGKTTALDVHIEFAACHTASLPVAINLQCWAARGAFLSIDGRGRLKYYARRSKDARA